MTARDNTITITLVAIIDNFYSHIISFLKVSNLANKDIMPDFVRKEKHFLPVEYQWFIIT